jgi:hypothetical protein
MNPEQIKAAFIAWNLAIDSFLGQPFPQPESLEDRAKSFGRQITNAESLEFVSTWFDWEVIESFLSNQDGTA